MSELTRRHLLAAAGAGAGLSTAGCLGSDGGGDNPGDESDSGNDGEPAADNETGTDGSDGEPDDSDDEPGETDGHDGAGDDLPSLQYVRIENDHDRSHAAHVLVENAGEIVHWSSHDIAADGAVAIDRNWTADPGAFVVSVRLDDQTSWSQIDLTSERPNCYGVIPRITAEGTIEHLLGPNPEGCGTAEDDSTDGSN